MNDLLRAFSGTEDVYTSAWAYMDVRLSLIPCRVNKRPATPSWTDDQTGKQHLGRKIDSLKAWFLDKHPSIGVVCGAISNNLVVIDLDGVAAMSLFYNRFPEISGKTLTILTGSGKGCHLYFYVESMPANINVRVDGVGGFEMRGDGQYVIAPPSPHPSGGKYQAVSLSPIQRVYSLSDIRDWFESLRERESHNRQQQIASAAQPVRVETVVWKQNYLATVVSQELARVTTASRGNRNDSLFTAGLKLANYCAGGELSRFDIEARLLAAAHTVSLPPTEAQRTIASAFRIGWQYPKQVPPPQEG